METNQKNQDESILALMYAEVKKITKHLKIDRRSKSNPDDPEATYIDEGERLLRELVEKMDDLRDRKDFTAGQVTTLEKMVNGVANFFVKGQAEQHNELKPSLEKIEEALEALKAEKQDCVVEHHHHHSIEIASSKVFISMIAMGVIIMGLSYVIGDQLRTLSQFRDNDLKYRYIQMKGAATPDDVLQLRNLFEFSHNPDAIKTVRRQVERYEKLVREQAENEARARLSDEQAKQLKQEAETIKRSR